MAEALIDFAGLEDSAISATTNTEVNTEDVNVTDAGNEVDNSTEEVTTEDKTGTEDSEKNPDGSDKTAEQKNEDKNKSTGVEDKNTPKTISEALKALKADPKNSGAAKILRDSYFGEQAFKKEFKSVQEARDAKSFIEAVGGAEGWENAQSVLQNIEETDELVRAGDPKIWENIVEDLKSEGKIDVLPKLASGGLDTLKATNQAQYEEVILPHFLQGLKDVNMPGAVTALAKYLAVAEKELSDAKYEGGKTGLSALKVIAGDLKGWMDGLLNEAKTKEEAATKVDPEREKFLAEKKDFETQKAEKAQTEAKQFREGVALECDKYSNRALGSELKGYLKMPFFKGSPRETLVDLGNGIKENLYSALEADKAYQIQMKGMWKQKNPDKAKIGAYHNSKLDAIAADVVKRTIEKRYPGYAKGGSAAGRVAAAATKKENENKTSATSVATGKPVYVASKPKDLIRDANVVKDWQMLEITGKGFVRGADGKMRLVTWRK